MKLLGVGPKRSVVVNRERDRLVYRSFDYASLGAPIDQGEGVFTNRPSSVIVGGTEDAHGNYRFAKAGYVVTVRVNGNAGTPPPGVVVTRLGKRVGAMRFFGYETAPRAAVAVK